jgi:hypothetical protein
VQVCDQHTILIESHEKVEGDVTGIQQRAHDCEEGVRGCRRVEAGVLCKDRTEQIRTEQSRAEQNRGQNRRE